MTYRQIILKLLEDEPKRHFKSYELLKVATKYGWIGTSGDRVARHLAEEGKVNHVSRNDEGYAEFWFKSREPNQGKLI